MLRPLSMLLFASLLPAAALAAPTIENPADPPAVETWHLREVWCLDNEEDPDLPLMGVILQGVVDDNGHVLLLDKQLCQVLEIAPDGEFVRTLSRRGQGPGEIENPGGLFLDDDGRLGLYQFYPGKIVWVNRDDTPGQIVTATDGIAMFARLREAGGNLVAHGQVMDGDGYRTHRYLARIGPDGERGHIYLESWVETQVDPPVSDETNSWFPWRAWDLLADGSLAFAPGRNEYRIEVHAPDGTISRIIRRDFSPHVRTKEERQKVEDGMRMWGPDGEMDCKKIILDTEPALHAIQVTDDGRIWVQTCYRHRDLPDGSHTRYDVFDSEGRLEREVRIAWPVNRERDHLALLADGRFLWFRNAKSAQNAMYAHIEDHDDEVDLEEEDLLLQVVLLEVDSVESSGGDD